MAKWRYTLKSGKDLRAAIDDEAYEEIIEALKDCYFELRDHEIIDEDDCDTYVSDLDFIDLDDDYVEDDIDAELNDFYDLCDNLKVWVDM